MITNLVFHPDFTLTFDYDPPADYGKGAAPVFFYAAGQDYEPRPQFLLADLVALSGGFPSWEVQAGGFAGDYPGVRRSDDPELFALAVQYWLMMWGVQAWGAVEPFDPERSWESELALIRHYLRTATPARPYILPDCP